MEYFLMNRNQPVLLFDLEDSYMKVLNNQFLPYMLKDYVKDTDFSTESAIKHSIRQIAVLRDFFCSRLLNLSRSGAKEILNVTNFPQSLKTEERLKISIACRGLSMTDDFWIKKPDEDLEYKDVCLRSNPLSNKSFDIAILQKHISATREELRPDLSTVGMFPKFWRRSEDGTVELWKTDRTSNFSNTRAEILVSEALDNSNIPHVSYELKIQGNHAFAVSKCFVSDEYSFASAEDFCDYLSHTAKEDSLSDYFRTPFANMVCIDYVFANTDRHFGNFGFMVENETNEIVSFAPLFDHNQALIADELGTNIDDLIYEPTGLSYKESVKEFAKYSEFAFTTWSNELPDKCRERYIFVEQCKEKQYFCERM